MIRSSGEYLRYVDGVRRRTLRDVATLPKQAEGWVPPQIFGRRRDKVEGSRDGGTMAWFLHWSSTSALVQEPRIS